MPSPASTQHAIHTPHHFVTPDPGQPWLRRLAEAARGVASSVMAGTGLAMIGLAVATHVGSARKAAEVFLGLVVLVAAGLLARSREKLAEVGVGILPGDVCLAGALLYLSVAMPAFQQGATRSQAVGQFIAVVVGLVIGCAGLVYSRAPIGNQHRPSFAVMVRDGVLLITGTIVVAMATSQISNPALKPPKWNWVSFLGLTVPGMLVLVGREGVKQALHRPRSPRSETVLAHTAIIEVLLVIGLSIMIFGSNANLALGKNGYQTGLQGNTAGLTLWLSATVFLIIVRGAAKSALPTRTSVLGRSVATGLLYVVGVLALIYGERAVQMGKNPVVSVGGASLPAALILAGGAAVLMLMRPAARALDAIAHQQSTTTGITR